MNNIPRPEFPRPDRMRKDWQTLNGEWAFCLFEAGREAEERAFAAAREAYPEKINVPFSWTCPLSGVEKNVPGVGWYRKEACFAARGRVFLCFGAVDYRSDVYVNGVHALSHQGGYTAFEADVTELWREESNTIEVRAEDYRLETQTYGKQGYGDIQGIWQSVWLEDRPASHIESFRFDAKCSGDVVLTASVRAQDGEILAARFDGKEFTGTVWDGACRIEFTLENPRLWSPDSPELYEGALALGEDLVFTYFGVREISVAPVEGRAYPWILLNGKPLYLNGTLDQAFNPQGHFTYPTDQDMKMEAFRLKRLGLNMVRIHIKPEEPRKLYWMDKLGVLVMADIPCFWGEPNEAARAAYEAEWPDIIARDLNHPSIFAWVMFNESWGLFTKTAEGRKYTHETQEWVRSVYRRAKQLDPSRIVEDNSPCNYDHVETDINTWHFYLNGYETVRDHIRKVVSQSYPGSSFNMIGDNGQASVPLINSECGMVWGVEGSAGDSDLAWQYHYMLNEYRLHEKLQGFVFTEFHDVVNEFNGYYRIDDKDKDFGYQAFARGMTIADLHAQDFVATDAPPCQTVSAGQQVSVPLSLSSFSDAHRETGLELVWELWHDAPDGRVSDQKGRLDIPAFGYGNTALAPLSLAMPDENAVAVLSLYLTARDGRVISRNFTTFDVRAALAENVIEVPLASAKISDFPLAWQAQGGEKLNLGGQGSVSFTVPMPSAPLYGLTLIAELGAKRVLRKDLGETDRESPDLGFMRGYLVDRGAFENSYWMTDEDGFPSDVDILVNGEIIRTVRLDNDYADARGVLSWHMQKNDRRLDEAGAYGQQIVVDIPSRLLGQIMDKGKLTLTFKVKGEGGLSLYGRCAGRYAHGVQLKLR